MANTTNVTSQDAEGVGRGTGGLSEDLWGLGHHSGSGQHVGGDVFLAHPSNHAI